MARARFEMRGLLFGLGSFIALAFSAIAMLTPQSALAADAIIQEIPVAAADVDTGHNWSGPYIGAFAGYGWAKQHDVSNPNAAEQKADDFLGGVTLGYNYQFDNNIVLGAEIDQSFGKVGKSWGGSNQYDPYYGEDSISNLGTARVRVGYAADRFLPYITGGLAWADLKHGLGCDVNRVPVTNGCQNNPYGLTSFETNKSGYEFGYALGAGVEYAVTDSISLKTEYLYADFGKNKVTLSDPNYPALSERNFKSSIHTIRVGLNYHF